MFNFVPIFLEKNWPDNKILEVMTKNLVIVESPAKARTIEGFLGKDYLVKSSFGHVRDLSRKNLSVDIENDFEPKYEISADKTKVIKELKKIAKDAETVWLASDEDREGEAISWHLVEALNLNINKVKRIVFHEITKSAILESIHNPRGIDMNLVDAQQARRVLDRLVGFEVSPILWKKVKPALSAGRVQSVAVRLIVDRENVIKNFTPTSSYKVYAVFILKNGQGKINLNAELIQKYKTREEAVAFLNKCINAKFQVSDIETKPVKKLPAPPFTTSTLQQEASRKLGFSVANTMRVAQQLYESGRITYMRTDSVNLSKMAMAMARDVIQQSYGDEYVKIRKFTTRTKGAQEAHEAIRPTYLNTMTIEGDSSQRRLYELIWKRTVASQMSEARLEKTNVTIDISSTNEQFVARGEVIKFDGFLKVYLESSDDKNGDSPKGMLPPLTIGEIMDLDNITAIQKFTQPSARYTEASLVKKLEELGIGRPSTYAPIISTIQKREYVVKGDKTGILRDFDLLTLKNNKIKEEVKNEKTGFVKGKLMPTDIGVLVNSFLIEHFKTILDYNFTASVEKEFDEIASGKKVWNDMIREFYEPFHKIVEQTMERSEKVKGEKLLGTDPESGKNIYVKLGKYGPIVQLGDTDNTIKPRFAGLRKEQSLDSITLEDALELFKLPRTIGEFEGEELVVSEGRYGPYVKHKSAFFSLAKTDDPLTIKSARAIELIEAKRIEDKSRIIKEFNEEPDLKVLKGKWGPYISFKKTNYKIPKEKDPAALSLDECRVIMENFKPGKTKRKTRKAK